MGIGYVDSVVVYNRHTDGLMEEEQYYGTRFDSVRIELTQAADRKVSGLENVSACVVKIPNRTFPKPYKPPPVWKELTPAEMAESFTLDAEGRSFFVIARKEELGIDIELPLGRIEGADYEGGFFEYIKEKYGYAYEVSTVDVYRLIPRYEIGGS